VGYDDEDDQSGSTEYESPLGVVGDEAEDDHFSIIEELALRQEALCNAFSRVFSSGLDAELVLGYLVEEYKYNDPLIDLKQTIDPLALALREGRRQVVVDIINRMSENSTTIEIPTKRES
jgi:hypothetical protein